MMVSGRATENSGGLAIDAPADRLTDALWLLASVVGVPQISIEAFESERRSMLEDEENDSSRNWIDLLAASIFGLHHPYGRRFSELRTSLQRAVPDFVELYRRTHLIASETALVVVGPTTREALEPAARTMFGSWPAAVTSPRRPTPLEGLRPRTMFVDQGHVGLARILVALPGVSRTSPEYPAMLLLEQIIGGLFGGRLNLTLREQLGLVYSSYAGQVSFRDAGMIVFSTQVETVDAVMTLRELMQALRNVHDTGITRDELVQARRTWHTAMHAQMEDLDSIAVAVESLFENGLPPDEYERLGALIDALTTDELNRVAASQIRLDRAMVLIGGDRSAIGSGVERTVGYVEFLDAR
jgi:predicted Zn-dependent peptidase